MTPPPNTHDEVNLPDSSDDEIHGPEARALRQADQQLFARLMAELNENQHDVLNYRIALGYSTEETARLLNSTAGAIRVSQHHALGRMRVLMAQIRTAVDEHNRVGLPNLGSR